MTDEMPMEIWAAFKSTRDGVIIEAGVTEGEKRTRYTRATPSQVMIDRGELESILPYLKERRDAIKFGDEISFATKDDLSRLITILSDALKKGGEI